MRKRYVALVVILIIGGVGFSQRDALVTRLLQVGIDRQFSLATIGSYLIGLRWRVYRFRSARRGSA